MHMCNKPDFSNPMPRHFFYAPIQQHDGTKTTKSKMTKELDLGKTLSLIITRPRWYRVNLLAHSNTMLTENRLEPGWVFYLLIKGTDY